MKKVRVDIWSDLVCPWCALGKFRFEGALARFERKDDVEIVWRSFELDRSAPAVYTDDNASRLARKLGRPREQVIAMAQGLADTAAKEGLTLNLMQARTGNTFDAHRLLHLARERGVQGAVVTRFFRGYMSEGEAIGEREALTRLACEAGLPADDVERTLASDRFAAEVRADEDTARQLGVHGVPFFLLNQSLAVSGAQPADVLLHALERAL